MTLHVHSVGCTVSTILHGHGLNRALYYPSVGSSVEGFKESGLSDGVHELIIRPVDLDECTRRIGLRVDFTVS